MNAYANRTAAELQAEYAQVKSHFEDLKAKALKLNKARGKPGKEQLDMVSDILTVLQKPEECVSDGIDVRNYGELSGIPAAKKLFAEILGCQPEEAVVIGDMPMDIGMGRGAGVRTCGVTYGNASRETLLEAGAEFVIDQIGELLDILQN